MRYVVLFQTRTLVTVPPSQELSGEATVKIGFSPICNSFGDPVTIDAETPEAAFTLANAMKPSPGFLMAVEPLPSFHSHQRRQNARRVL